MDLLMELIDANTPAPTPAAQRSVTPTQATTAPAAQRDGAAMDARTSDAPTENRKTEGNA